MSDLYDQDEQSSILDDIAAALEPLDKERIGFDEQGRLKASDFLYAIADYLDGTDLIFRQWLAPSVERTYGREAGEVVRRVFTPKPGDSVQEDLRGLAALHETHYLKPFNEGDNPGFLDPELEEFDIGGEG